MNSWKGWQRTVWRFGSELSGSEYLKDLVVNCQKRRKWTVRRSGSELVEDLVMNVIDLVGNR